MVYKGPYSEVYAKGQERNNLGERTWIFSMAKDWREMT